MALDLTGVWSSNDGGTYYVRQIGNEIVWYGEPSNLPSVWSNVAYGTIDPNKVVSLNWADVPKGTNRLSGEITLQVSANGKEMTAIAITGGMANRLMKKTRD